MLEFRSLKSGSSGNSLLLQTTKSRILIDCGLGSQLACNLVLSEHLGKNFKIDGICVSHTHSDHINYSALRICQQHRIPLYIHERSLAQLGEKHYNGYRFDDLILKPFTSGFDIGDLSIEPIELRHEPLHATFGFVINYGSNGSCRKLVAATDFTTGGVALLESLIDADLIFIESNHDPKLLRENPNYASCFHMPNHATAQLLFDARLKSKKPPQAVMLGHLSEKRNREEIALKTVESTFAACDRKIDFTLLAAPRHKASPVITLEA
jgi:phosphoribosyl 1,2-cyclic phosphodiesterase